MRPLTVPLDKLDTTRVGARLSGLSADKIVEWASRTFDEGLAMSTSFGIQSAVMLHLVTQVRPNIPVIWIDTGYLPAETYRFADELATHLSFNLHVYQSPISPARTETLMNFGGATSVCTTEAGSR